MSEHHLDAKGLNCPLPILRAKKTLAGMESGDTLHIEATDPGSIKDFEAFCNQTGHHLEKSGCQNGAFIFDIKKS
jgi:tRNA 2-thiouridine synthesizing protein A